MEAHEPVGLRRHPSVALVVPGDAPDVAASGEDGPPAQEHVALGVAPRTGAAPRLATCHEPPAGILAQASRRARPDGPVGVLDERVDPAGRETVEDGEVPEVPVLEPEHPIFCRADPERPGPVAEDREDASGQPSDSGEAPPLPAEQTRVGADPQRPVSVLVDRPRLGALEPGVVARERHPGRIEADDGERLGPDPEHAAAPGLDAQQPVGRQRGRGFAREDGEADAVEAGEAGVGRHPEVAVSTLRDIRDGVGRQAVGDGPGPGDERRVGLRHGLCGGRPRAERRAQNRGGEGDAAGRGRAEAERPGHGANIRGRVGIARFGTRSRCTSPPSSSLWPACPPICARPARSAAHRFAWWPASETAVPRRRGRRARPTCSCLWSTTTCAMWRGTVCAATARRRFPAPPTSDRDGVQATG